MVSNMAKESGRSDLMTNSVTCTRATTKMTKRTAWVCLLGSPVITIEGVTRMTRGMAMVRCTGPTAPSTKENGKRVYKMEEVS